MLLILSVSIAVVCSIVNAIACLAILKELQGRNGGPRSLYSVVLHDQQMTLSELPFGVTLDDKLDSDCKLAGRNLKHVSGKKSLAFACPDTATICEHSQTRSEQPHSSKTIKALLLEKSRSVPPASIPKLLL